MVTAAMSIAIGQEPTRITEENDLLEFAVASGELIIRRLLREFQLLFVTVVGGNRFLQSPRDGGTKDSEVGMGDQERKCSRRYSRQEEDVMKMGLVLLGQVNRGYYRPQIVVLDEAQS